MSQAVKTKRETFKYKQRVHKVVDVPSDYAALRQSLSNSTSAAHSSSNS